MGAFPKVTDFIDVEQGLLDSVKEFCAFENEESRQFSSPSAAFYFIVMSNQISMTEVSP